MTVEISHKGKAVLITGAGAGIGREIALWFCRSGAKTALLDKRGEKLEETQKLISAEGGESFGILGDARNDQDLDRMISEASEAMGGLDVAVNNIGMLGPAGSPEWMKMDAASFRDAVDQNLVLTAVACMAESRIMVGNESDSVILNVSSGETTRPSPALAGYAAAKAGINHLTQSLAVELGPHGIRVNAMAPGTTFTEEVRGAFTDEQHKSIVESTPLRRETLSDELGRLSVFLASDLARCITGQLFLADAGAHLSRSRPLLG